MPEYNPNHPSPAYQIGAMVASMQLCSSGLTPMSMSPWSNASLLPPSRPRRWY